MKLAAAILSGVVGISLVACERPWKRAKSLPPAPQPKVSAAKTEPSAADSSAEPLSIPQTQVQLPRLQPIPPDAVATLPAASLPEAPALPRSPRSGRRAPAASTAKPEAPAEAAEELPAAEAQRPPVQPILPPDERRQLIEEIATRLRETNDLLGQVTDRRLSGEQKSAVSRIRSFVKLSQQALERGDTQQAGALADRALLLAQELLRAR